METNLSIDYLFLTFTTFHLKFLKLTVSKGASSVLVQKVKFVIQILLFSVILWLKFVQTPLMNTYYFVFKPEFQNISKKSFIYPFF